MPSPLSTDMEIVSQAAIRVQNKPVNVLSNKGLIRKKSTPYKQCDPLPLRAKTKAPDSREDDEVTVIAEVRSPVEETTKSCEQNNYELLLQQQKLFLQWQHNDDNPTQSQDEQMQYDVQPTSRTTSPPNQVIIRRLSDYKVQELKNECKKRQLPVSGAKPQLLERLRPFEKAILGASPSPTPEPVQFNSSSSSSTTSSSSQEAQQPPAQEVAEPVMQAEPAAHCQLQVPVQVSQYSTEQMRSTVGISDYLGRPVVLQLSPQLVQLTDAKGTPVGVASVQYIPGSGHPVMLSYHTRATPQPNNSQPIASIQPDSSLNNAQRRVAHILPLQHGAISAHTQQTVIANVPSLSQPRVVQATQVVQKQNDNTFRFAQMGSGGQFTIAPSNDRVPNKNAPIVMNTADHIGTPQTSLTSSKPNITNIVEINRPTSQLTTTVLPQAPLIVSLQPTNAGYHASPHDNLKQDSYQATVVQNVFASEGMNPCLQDSPRTADLAGDSPHMPNSGQSETIAETGDGTIENPITFDDPSSILTPAALSMHEEMLRAQQKKIEVLLEELAKSQAHLKREQQLILTAKKAQQRIREQQREKATNREREQWLRELDVGHINKQHIQHFLQHKKQQAALQRHLIEHNRLTTTEARLQEELHVEQAVQDIVRLIKQDPRTALLIVQLLRRYQLERNAEQQQASSPDTDKVSQVNSPASGAREPQARSTCEVESRNFEQKTNAIEDDQQSVVICDASGMQLNHDRIFVYHQNTGVCQEEKSQSVDMEEIFKSVLEDASRAINSDVAAAQSVDCSMTNNVEQSQQTMVICQQQWQQPVQLSEMEIEGSLIQNTTQPQQVVTQAMMNAEANVVQQPTVVLNNAHNYQTQHIGYSQDIEDLMAVLRDDQDGGMKSGPFQMDLGVGYGSEELADLLGEDWLDCADRSIANNGQYAPYESEPHEGVGGRSTDPMCMQSHSEVGIGDQNMDWLDVMLQNAPIEQRPYGST
ncbi:hypothetical protein KIN20_017963 [Parelaphostrongylus tenuis]|uniref:SAP domain-containing protein n=1 Tax=Parelaphostrongylus tenuis TaxID=148309 RepID=A0AAD5MM89_PARTN|nr:hypothetical protein KIN20_017963 [Parelaphostrongylus tenuis]